ncbi:FHF complex subunit HOOK-interacting protein 1B isoform X2 [Monodelphis domestica]|uniref:FHF complex subunit HOOK-interacting protein 1B isoform X2 n=1 Tax=Monodelphis domestica TaxID=13616 RepID=UPI0024E23CFB|nr:FHF complex subunit HOOK-interacting protein 1B isoform X2 [Monodelphis domestica]
MKQVGATSGGSPQLANPRRVIPGALASPTFHSMEKMSWLSKLAPRGPGHRAPRTTSLQTPVTADPETCLMVFKNHWSQVVRILERRAPQAAPGGSDDLSAVHNHMYQMLTLLVEDRVTPSAPTAPGPLLEFALHEDLLARVLAWQLQWDGPGDGVGAEERRAEQLKLFEMLVSEARQPLLHHQPVREALLTLLEACGPPTGPALDAGLVLLLSQLCVCVAREPALLELFLQPPPEPGAAPRLLLFSRLVPFVHREGTLGQQARDALLLLMALSAGSPTVGRYIADHSYFCPVLATGLSALYSSLPRKIEVRGDDWHCLRREDWLGVPALALFMSSLEFCNAVIQVAHPLVQKQLVDYIHNGFLVPVMGPALHKLCMVSLSLFRTLLNLNCEDVVLQLVLRYLVPCNHVMLSQKRAVRDLDLYGRAADKFLSLIPRCCRHRAPSPPHLEQASWARGPGSPNLDSSSVVTVPRPSTPSRLALFLRQQSLGGTEPSSPAPRSPSLVPSPASSPGHRPGPVEEPGELEDNYLEYLREARRCVDHCVHACRSWSAPYDGEQPPADPSPVDPSSVPTGPRTKKRSLQPEEEDGEDGAEGEEEELGGGGHAEARILSLGEEEGSGLLTSLQVNGALGPWPEGAKKVRRGPRGGVGEQKGGIGGLVGLEGFGRELRELEVALSNGGAGPDSCHESPLPPEEEEAVYESFSCPPEPLGPLLSSPLRIPSQLPSQPFTGPFMAVLFAKLENMLQNSLYVNFLLTGLVAQLACYPQPLLRSFLLNTNMVFQPSVKSLLQVLGSVKNKIESFAASQEDFPALLSKAKKYLIARGKLDWAEGPGAGSTPRRPDTLVKARKPSLGELLLRHAHSPTRSRQTAQVVPQLGREGPGPALGLGVGLGPHSALGTSPLPLRSSPAERQGEALRIKNAVYCAVVFPEFLKELAAISQAHAVTSPFLLEAFEEGPRTPARPSPDP